MRVQDLQRRGLLGLALTSLAAKQTTALAQDTTAAIVPIQRFYVALLAVMKAGRMTLFSQRYQMLAPALEQAFNVPAIARAAVGLAWSSFPPNQQAQVLASFTRYTVSTWVSNFDTYSGQRLDVLSNPRAAGSALVVTTQIVSPSGKTNVIDYVMRSAGSSWRAVDVLLDASISQVAVLRSDFGAIAIRGAGALAESLDRKSADLMGSTAPV
jgi:phospholipid transport system substrate-binding protein